MEKLKTITGDKLLTVSKMHVFVQRGVQSNAATDMKACINGGATARTCREKVSATIATALGQNTMSPQKADSMLRKGGYLAAKKKVAACREVAPDDASREACRSLSAMKEAFAAATGTSRADSALGEEIKREMDREAFMEAASAAASGMRILANLTEDQISAAEKERSSLLKQELSREIGLNLDENPYLFNGLKRNAASSRAASLALACVAGGQNENCNIEEDLERSGLASLKSRRSGFTDRKNHAVRRQAMRSALMEQMISCEEQPYEADRRSCTQSDDVESIARVLRASTNHLANDMRRAASEMATQRALDCKVGNGSPRSCEAEAQALLERLSKGDEKKETYASASMRRVHTAVTMCLEGEDRANCKASAASDIQLFGYNAHQVDSIMIQNAKSAAALAHADAEAEGDGEKLRLQAARDEFKRFAPASLFDEEAIDAKTGEKVYPTRKAVLALAAVNMRGEATEMVSSDEEIVSVINLQSKCDQKKIDEMRRLISGAADDAATMSVASSPSGADDTGCQYIFKSKVKPGMAKALSKEISEQVGKGLRRMRRLGTSGASTGTVSSSPREEEVAYGTEPEATNWHQGSDSGSNSGSADSGDGYGSEEDFSFLNSAGARACAVKLAGLAAAFVTVISLS